MARSWYEQDALWTTLEPILAGRHQRDRAAAETPRMIELAALPLSGRVADFGSGSGRFAVPFARAGRKVTAIDHCAALVSKLAKEADAGSLPIEIVRRDLRSFERAGAFEAVLLWGDTFGYYDRSSDDAQVLQHALRSLSPKGRLLLQLTPRELAASHWPERTWSPLPDKRTLLEEHTIIRNLSAIRHTWTVIGQERPTTFTGTRRLYSAVDVIRMLHKVGFSHADCFGALDGRPYGRHAETLIVVATP